MEMSILNVINDISLHGKSSTERGVFEIVGSDDRVNDVFVFWTEQEQFELGQVEQTMFSQNARDIQFDGLKNLCKL